MRRDQKRTVRGRFDVLGKSIWATCKPVVRTSVAISAIGIPAQLSMGAASTWDGSISANWNGTSGTDTNFTGGSGTNGILASGDSLTFNSTTGAGGATLNNNLTTSAFSIAGITFASGAPSYTINGNAFSLTNAGIINASSNSQTFGTAITLSTGVSDTTVNPGSTSSNNTITFNGGINYGTSRLFTATNGGTIVLNAAGTGNGRTGVNVNSLTSANSTQISGYVMRTNNAGTIVELGNAAALGTGALQVNTSQTLRSNTALAGASAVGNAVVLTNSLTIGGANNLELAGSTTSIGSGASGSAGAVIVSGADRQLTISNTAATTISGKVSLSDDAATGRTLTVDVGSTAGTTTISGTIQNYVGANGTGTGGVAGSLVKTNAGALTLNGSNTYSGNTTLTGGTINVGHNSALGTGTLILNGGTLQNASGSLRTLGNAVTVNAQDAGIVAGAGGFTFNGGIAFGTNNVSLKTTAGTTSLNSAGTGSGFLAAGGIFSLNTANNTNVRFGLRNDISGSILVLGNGTALGTGAAYANVGSLTVQSSTALTGPAAVGNTFIIGGNSNGLTVGGSNAIEFSGTSTAAGSGAAGSAGAVINAGGNKTLFVTNTNATTISGKVSLSDDAATGRTLSVDVAGTAGTTTISGSIADYVGSNGSSIGGVAGSLTKTNLGTLVLSGSNTFNGAVTINGGVIKLGNTAALGTTVGNTTISSGTTLDLNGTATSEVLSVTGSGVGGNGALVNSDSTTAATLNSEISNGASFTVGGAGAITIQRARSGGAPITLTKIGAGTLTIGNSNTTTHMNLLAVDIQSASTVNFGISSGNYLVADRGVKIANGGTAKYTGTSNNFIGDNQEAIVSNGTFDMNGVSDTVGRVSIGDGTNSGVVSGSGSTLTVSGSYQAFGLGGSTLSGGIEAMRGTVNVNLAGAAPLTKTTAATVTLNGGGSWTGATHINAGTLAVGAFGGITGSATITVASGATFDTSSKGSSGFNVLSTQTLTNNGTVTGGLAVSGTLKGTGTVSGAVDVNNGGKVSSGNSVGTLGTGALSLASGSINDIEFNGVANDLVNVTGNLSLTTGWGVNLLAEGTSTLWSTNGTYTLFDYSGSLGGTGAAQPNLGATFLQTLPSTKSYSISNDATNTLVKLTIANAGNTIALTSNGGLASGSDLGDITTSGSNGNYVSTIANVGSAASGYVDIFGTLPTPLSDQVLVAVDFVGTPDLGSVSFVAGADSPSFTLLTSGAVLAGINATFGGGFDAVFAFNGLPASGSAGNLDFGFNLINGLQAQRIVAVPEPTTGLMAGVGVLSLVGARRRRKR